MRDASGAAVADARVSLRGDGVERDTRTGPDGRFSFAEHGRTAVIVVEAAGYAPLRRAVDLRKDVGPLTMVLRRAFADEVTVSAARIPERLAETPASVVVLGARALELTPALAVDDALRQVPGFTLFRRSGSRTANPTTQGASTTPSADGCTGVAYLAPRSTASRSCGAARPTSTATAPSPG